MEQPDAHMQERENEKATALADIIAVLHQIEAQRRNPDQWERVHLVQAVVAVFSGCYTLASVEARSALTPLEHRSPTAALPHDPIFDQCDLQFLMQVWHAAQAEPVDRFPHFGPVTVRGAVAANPGKAWLR
jgi:hypothetical protein